MNRRLVFLSVLFFSILGFSGSAPAGDAAGNARPEFSFPLLAAGGGHMAEILENCLRYVRPQNAIVDAASGYPFEGWNHEPEKGVFLRSFTQLTAIGSWIEVLANIAAGYADNPYLSRTEALGLLEQAVKSLRADQQNPQLSAKGLLVNFLALEGGVRKGPLEETVERQKFFDAFGEKTGAAIWKALLAAGWISLEKQGHVGRVMRSGAYGWGHFTGALAPFADEKTKAGIMRILDARAVLVIFGDNVNLTASVAKAVGALLREEIRDNPRAILLRQELELFIEAQGRGYRDLYDESTGTLAFGWDAGRNRFIGWDDSAGNWVTGRMDYFISEFRGGWIFSVLRYQIPRESIKNAGFKIKPYHDATGAVQYGLCAWDGSAFQLLGFTVFMGELRSPGWRACLEQLVDIELDYSQRLGLPGFLSEAYSGNGAEYTRFIGIPQIAITDRQLIDYAPSLYSIGACYQIAPRKIEAFLSRNWPAVSSLLTDHGPWEGYDMRKKIPIQYQTTTHTLSLVLAGIGSADENMRRYLEMKGLSAALQELYAAGPDTDLLSRGKPAGWASDGSQVSVRSQGTALSVQSQSKGMAGLTFSFAQEQAVSFSGGKLRLRYRSAADVPGSRIVFKRSQPKSNIPETLPVEIFLEIKKTGDGEDLIEICLPATPALQNVRELSLIFEQGRSLKAGITLTGFEFKAH